MSKYSVMAGQLKIGADWLAGCGDQWASHSPADQQVIWDGHFASVQQVSEAIAAADQAFPIWSETSLEQRIAICKSFAEVVGTRCAELANLIVRETGKPLWEAETEVGTVIGKVANSVDAILGRRWTTTEKSGEILAVTRYRPHGVMLVLGPFNFPAHLPGSHIVPALLAGNTIVFKPSELTPAVGEWLVKSWEKAGLPAGVLNLIQGSREVAESAIGDARIAGVLFTGSRRVGESIHRSFAGQPEKILALEMGGNNPLVIHETKNLDAAALAIIQSAYITSGQRCTCARRLILTEQSRPQKLIARLRQLIPKIRVGLPLDEPQPFMGPLIRAAAAQKMLEAQSALEQNRAEVLIPMRQTKACAALLSPGLVDATGRTLEDVEHFGPLLTIQRAADFDEAIGLANATHYGLAAGLISDKIEHFHYFLHHIRAGVINWNRQTTGASGRLPFGGVGASGNHHPSGYFAADYCSYPVASLQGHGLDGSTGGVPGLEEVAHACSLK